MHKVSKSTGLSDEIVSSSAVSDGGGCYGDGVSNGGNPSGCWSTAPHAVVLTLMREHYYCVYLYMLCRLMYWHMLLIYTKQLPVSGL